MKFIQKSNFRVQDMFFFNNCIEKNQNKTHFEEGSRSHTSLRDGSGMIIRKGSKCMEMMIKMVVATILLEGSRER